jgi:type II secretory pathway component GspD/PulD (secretin)
LSFLATSSLFGQKNTIYNPLDKNDEEYNLNEKMSINMKDSDIKNILMLIGELTGLNIVISPAVKDTITATLENVSVKAALDAILKPNGYNYFVQENIIIVKGIDTEMVGELETVVVKLKYINSDDLSGALDAVMSSRGKLQSFTPLVTSQSTKGASNIIVISDVQENIVHILNMIDQLDVAIPNINIAVRFIETNLDTTRGHGIDWSKASVQLGGTTDTSLSMLNFNNITIATLNPMQLTSALRIMQARGRSKLLSSPQVTTLDNHEAETETVTTVYIEGNTNSSQNQYNQGNQPSQSSNPYGNIAINQVSEKDIGIKLKVTPRINEGTKITLLVDATVEALLSAAEINTDKPRSTKRTVKTQVTVRDGDTAIIGGLIAENVLENKKFIPIISGIPFFGQIFQSTSIEKEQRELLIFITPNIIN